MRGAVHQWCFGGAKLLALVLMFMSGCGLNGAVGERSDMPVKLPQQAAPTDTSAHRTFNTRIDGISFSAPPRPVGREVFDTMAVANAEWVAVVPYAYGPGENGRLIWQGTDWQWWGESLEGTRAQIRSAKAAGLRVMLKPHLWLGHGEFTGTFAPADSTGWITFEESYREYLLLYADLAHTEGVELLCIGTELRVFTQARPAFWNDLIAQVRQRYQGAITYAANWDEVSQVPFWSQLDAIGVDGYFPLTAVATPTTAMIEAGWQPHLSTLGTLAERLQRKVLFTEMGYCCTATCAAQPWQEDRSAARDDAAQARAYQAFFNTMHRQPWYAGCFVWKWFADGGLHEERRGNGFSPQRKAALHVLREAYGRE